MTKNAIVHVKVTEMMERLNTFMGTNKGSLWERCCENTVKFFFIHMAIKSKGGWIHHSKLSPLNRVQLCKSKRYKTFTLPDVHDINQQKHIQLYSGACASFLFEKHRVAKSVVFLQSTFKLLKWVIFIKDLVRLFFFMVRWSYLWSYCRMIFKKKWCLIHNNDCKICILVIGVACVGFWLLGCGPWSTFELILAIWLVLLCRSGILFTWAPRAHLYICFSIKVKPYNWL